MNFDDGPGPNTLAVGVAARVNVSVSVVLVAGLRDVGLNVHVNQLGMAELVSVSRQEKLIAPAKLPGFTVTVTCAVGAAGERFTVVGETLPAELLPAAGPLKKMSEFVAPLT